MRIHKTQASAFSFAAKVRRRRNVPARQKSQLRQSEKLVARAGSAKLCVAQLRFYEPFFFVFRFLTNSISWMRLQLCAWKRAIGRSSDIYIYFASALGERNAHDTEISIWRRMMAAKKSQCQSVALSSLRNFVKCEFRFGDEEQKHWPNNGNSAP